MDRGVGIGTWIVLAAIFLGKPLGILSATALSVALGLHKPDGVSWRDLMVVGIIAGIGFTVALFFATAAFPPGPLLEQAKMGALLSISGGAIAAAAFSATFIAVLFLVTGLMGYSSATGSSECCHERQLLVSAKAFWMGMGTASKRSGMGIPHLLAIVAHRWQPSTAGTGRPRLLHRHVGASLFDRRVAGRTT
jgi:hypothetical protein